MSRLKEKAIREAITNLHIAFSLSDKIAVKGEQIIVANLVDALRRELKTAGSGGVKRESGGSWAESPGAERRADRFVGGGSGRRRTTVTSTAPRKPRNPDELADEAHTDHDIQRSILERAVRTMSGNGDEGLPDE